MATSSTGAIAHLDKELETRYDRQIRLWGKSTQLRLLKTVAVFVGLDGLAAEIAKNLILGGVKQVRLAGEDVQDGVHTCNGWMCETTHVDTMYAVHCSDVAEGRQLLPCIQERLQELNPHVDVVLATGSSSSCSSPLPNCILGVESSCIVFATCVIRTISQALRLAHDFDALNLAQDQERTLLLTTHVGPYTCGFFVAPLVGDRTTATGTVDQLFSKEGGLEERPKPFQMCVLSLHVSQWKEQTLPFPQVLSKLLALRILLRANQVNDDDIQFLLDAACDAQGCGCRGGVKRSSGIVESSVAGGFLAQQIITRAGKGLTDRSSASMEEDGKVPSSSTQSPATYEWFATCTAPGDDVECYVG